MSSLANRIFESVSTKEVVREGYKPGSGDKVFVTEEQYEKLVDALKQAGLNSSLDVRGAGREAKIEGTEAQIEYLEKLFPELVVGEKFRKSNGKVSVRLNNYSYAASRLAKSMYLQNPNRYFSGFMRDLGAEKVYVYKRDFGRLEIDFSKMSEEQAREILEKFIDIIKSEGFEVLDYDIKEVHGQVLDGCLANVRYVEPITESESVSDTRTAKDLIEACEATRKYLENSTEDYYGTTEIDREGFTSLHKDKNGKYLIINDGVVGREFEAESDEEAKEIFRASLNETEYTREELKDKYGTDDVEIINAGKPEEERVEVKENDVDKEIEEFLESAYEDEEEVEDKPIPVCIFCGEPIEGEVFTDGKGQECHSKCYAASDEPEKEVDLNESAPASQVDFAHTEFESVSENIARIAELKAEDTENKLYSTLLTKYDEILKALKDYIGDQPMSAIVDEPTEAPAEVDGIDAEQIEQPIEPSSEEAPEVEDFGTEGE